VGHHAVPPEALYLQVGTAPPDSRSQIFRGGLEQKGRTVAIPTGLLYLMLARAGRRGKDGPLPVEMVRRLGLQDPRLPLLYLRPERDWAA
jgi:hypothetical protein